MKNKPLTQEDLQYLIDNWTTKSANEIGKKIGKSSQSILTIVGKLRKMGINLEKKIYRGDSNTMIEFVKKYKANK